MKGISVQKMADLARACGQPICQKCLQPLTTAEGPQARYHVVCRPMKFRNTIVHELWFGADVTFHSKKEALRAGQLILLENAGEIWGLTRQVRYSLIVNGIKVGTYTADFVYHEGPAPTGEDDDVIVVEDVKSEPTRRTDYYQLKRRLWEALYKPLTITEV